MHSSRVHKNLLVLANPLLAAQFREQIELKPRVFERQKAVLGLAVTNYETQLALLLADFKQTGNLRLIDWLIDSLATQVLERFGQQSWVLIPVPSAAKATLRRGFVPSELIAGRLAQHLKSGSRVCPQVWLRRPIVDQAALSVSQRTSNLSGAMAANPSLRKFSDQSIAVVDDVVTTGSSAAEVVRALAELGLKPTALFALAETLRKTQQKL